MSRSFDPADLHLTAGLFRPTEHVMAVQQGSSTAILDLEQGIVYATTPFGAESWSTLVGSRRQPYVTVTGPRSDTDDDEGRDALARVAGYLLDRRIIEPVLSRADTR